MSADGDDSELNIDNLIEVLLEVRGHDSSGKIVNISEGQIKSLCIKSKEIFLSQPMLLELEAPLKICGNIYGQYGDLLHLFECGEFPPKSNYLFLGNYIDRGRKSLETICLLLAYKVKYPDKIYLLRGNHECGAISRIYGFYDECKRRYSMKLWKSFIECFNCLPVAAIVNERIFCCQGGLSPDLQSFDQIRQIQRPIDVPDTGLLCDLLWADPDNEVDNWDENNTGISTRFGINVLTQFLNKHQLDLVCRAHKVVDKGYEFFGDRQLVTIFSAPNYLESFGNIAAIMSVDENLVCSFTVFQANEKRTSDTDQAMDSVSADANCSLQVQTKDSNKHVTWADIVYSASSEESTVN